MKILRFWKPLLWLAIILVLSLIPGNKLPGIPRIPHIDKVVHALMYFGLAVLLVRPLKRLPSSRAYIWAVLICLVIGTAVEYSQAYLTVNRSGSFYDELANAAGAILGVVFYHLFIRGFFWEKWA
jgi:VanZ family protein